MRPLGQHGRLERQGIFLENRLNEPLAVQGRQFQLHRIDAGECDIGQGLTRTVQGDLIIEALAFFLNFRGFSGLPFLRSRPQGFQPRLQPFKRFTGALGNIQGVVPDLQDLVAELRRVFRAVLSGFDIVFDRI